MPLPIRPSERVTTALSWPFGMAWTSFSYVWRILPVHRIELEGRLPDDLPPALPDGVSHDEIQTPSDGTGPLLHRLYSGAIRGAELSPEELMARLSADPNRLAPRQISRFRKLRGDQERMAPGDEFLVHMPGPWDGPVRTVEVRPDSFRFATLEGHLEAGQIEWRAWRQDGDLWFAVESWARAGDRLSAIMHDRLRMAKEVQLYMWTTVIRRVPGVAGGQLRDGVNVLTRRVPPEAFERDAPGAGGAGVNPGR
jgi:hypothetical protein